MSEEKPRRRGKSPPKLDQALTQEESNGLRIPPSIASQIITDHLGCSLPECDQCRIARAVAWVAKGYTDALCAVKVLQDVLDDMEADGTPDPEMNPALAFVALKELAQSLEEMQYWSKTFGLSLGLVPSEGDGITAVEIRDDGDGGLVAKVTAKVSKKRPRDGAVPPERAN